MAELLESFDQLSRMGRDAEARLRAVKTEIAARLGPAAAATLPGWEITHKTQKRAGYAAQDTEFRVLRIRRKSEEMAA
jgi:hypothetical protein